MAPRAPQALTHRTTASENKSGRRDTEPSLARLNASCQTTGFVFSSYKAAREVTA
jgi:hypothetical protein